jgi:gliding motility-associated-like protein
MKKTAILLCLLPVSCLAQMLTPTLIGSAGGYGTGGGATLSYSVGEPAVTTLYVPSKGYATQGFQQPDVGANTSLTFTLFVNNESCMNNNDGSAYLTVNGGTGKLTIVWTGDTTNNNSISSLKPGKYWVSVSDAAGLTQVDSFVIQSSEAPCNIHIYTGVTPNGDGRNDFWQIDNIESFPDNTAVLYNRWGSEVWRATGYNNANVSWRGFDAQGKPLPDGTYFYEVIVSGKTYKGWVQLTR